MVNPPTSAIVPGPDTDEPWGSTHHGRFRIADFGERIGQISFGARMSADGAYFTKIYARFSAWDEATRTFSGVGPDVLVYGPATIGDTGGEFGYTSQIYFSDVRAPEGATHWQPVIRWYSEAPGPEGGGEAGNSGIPSGAKVRMDDFFIPDNGYPINTRPYLDGDQSFGRWEGPRSASTSVYGVDPVVSLGDLVSLEEEFLLPTLPPFDFSTLTYLDDDLTI